MTTPDPGPRRPWTALAAPGLVALCFLAWSIALLWPALAGGAFVLPGEGGQDSDVIRGAWSLSQVAWGLPDPVFTERAFFPIGVKIVPLPFASGLLLAPLQFALGPLQAYDASLVLLLAATAWSAAWLGRECTGSWGLGALVGGALAAQPMLLHAVADGTPEHLALWSLPAALAATWRCHRTGDLRWAPAAGLLALALTLDSPYMGVFGIAIAPFFLGAVLAERSPRAGWRRLLPLLACAGCALPGAGLVAWLYHDLPLAPQDFTNAAAGVELAGNSVELRAWLNLESRRGADVLGNLVPALIPGAMLAPALALALLGGPRSLPWLLAGLATLAFALGTNRDNALMLGWWAGELLGPAGRSAGDAVGQAVIDANAWLLGQFPFSGIRFPRRWLVPAALWFGLAGAVGLRGLLALAARLHPVARIARRRLPLEAAGALGGLLVAALLLRHAPYLEPWVTTRFPDVAFAAWIRAQPGAGAVMAFPTVRPGRPNTHRWELPVYANIADALRSGDTLWFQLLHGRPDFVWPALLTAQAAGALPPEAARLVRDADDMARPAMTGGEPPNSSWDPADAGERARGRAWFASRGMRFVALDLSVYQGVWLERAAGMFEPLAGQQRFDDGDGVLVLELAP